MKEFKVIQVLYFLPIFFFTLAVSPNIVAWRIAYVFGLFYLIVIPVTNYATAYFRQGSSGNLPKQIIIYMLVFISLGLSIYLGWKINWQYVLLQIIFVVFILSVYSSPKVPGKVLIFLSFLLGTFLFSATYFGLNQYGFAQLIRSQNLVIAALCGLIIVHVLFTLPGLDGIPSALKVVKSVLTIEVLSFNLFFLYYFKWEYAALSSLALIPSTILSYTLKSTPNNSPVKINKKFGRLKLVYAISLSIFFIYFFLDSTQVLQAIKGGY